MDTWIKQLWNNNKILFCLLLPLVLLFFFRDLILSFLVGSARLLVARAKEKDEALKDQLSDALNKADRLKDEADALGDTANDLQIDEDWNKKGR